MDLLAGRGVEQEIHPVSGSFSANSFAILTVYAILPFLGSADHVYEDSKMGYSMCCTNRSRR
jgi:hypothetical protein